MLVIIKRTIEEIERSALESIAEQVVNFGNKFTEGTSDSNNFMSMDEIENNCDKLRKATDTVYSEMVGQMIEAIDEREIVRKKKENI